jgi:hypothetical protein
METYEGLLRVYFEKTIREMQEADKANWLQDCAQMVTQMVLRGKDEAILAAKIRLGQYEILED